MPSGTVTFVFTDIEGSTAMLRHLGAGYEPMLRRSMELLDQAWAAHGGHPLDGAGDSAFAAFWTAEDAIAACVTAQRLLATEPWAPGARPRVRMGAHTGLASPRGEGYVALAVHQAVRVMSAGHGDQVLVSEQCAAEVRRLDGIELVPLGRFRMRDFDSPPLVFRAAAPHLRRDFPALRAVPVDGHNLVRPPTPLLGRDDDVRAVVASAAAGRLLTLVGPGGVGKTRLATEAGIVAAPGWDDGVWMVDLAPLQDPALVGAAVASAVGADTTSGSDPWQDAVQHLSTRRALVVLDNCEHLVDALAPLVAELLARCPGVGLLATSRERIGVPGEQARPVAPLPLPAEDTGLAQAVATPAVQLLLDRARAVRPGFDVDNSSLDAVIGICRRVDGLPLALELVAAHLAVLPPARVLDGLQDRLTLLRSRDRGRPDRQRTLEGAIDWSVRLLAPQERVVLRRLGVFTKDFSLEAAAPALADGADVLAEDVPELVWRLCERSLVSVDLSGSDSRYRLLETVRAYASRQLADSGEVAATAERLAAWWVDRLGPWQPMDRLRSEEISDELENLRGLVPLVTGARPDLAQQLACAIGRFYYAVRAPQHSIDELTGYAEALRTPSHARVSLLTTLADLQVRGGDVEGAAGTVQEAVRVQAACGAPPWDDAAVERARGEVALRSADYETAGQVARAALEQPLTARGRVRMLNLLALSSHFAGDDAAAAAALQQELAVARSLDDDHLVAIAEGNLAELALGYGDITTAARHQRACLQHGLALGSAVQVAYSMVTAARLAAPTDPALAVRLHTRAELVLEEHGHRLYDEDREHSDRMLGDARAALGAGAYEAHVQAGATCPLAEATASRSRPWNVRRGPRRRPTSGGAGREARGDQDHRPVAGPGALRAGPQRRGVPARRGPGARR
jgi:predicted ATPase